MRLMSSQPWPVHIYMVTYTTTSVARALDREQALDASNGAGKPAEPILLTQ